VKNCILINLGVKIDENHKRYTEVRVEVKNPVTGKFACTNIRDWLNWLQQFWGRKLIFSFLNQLPVSRF
jgi:hypothetical protein